MRWAVDLIINLIIYAFLQYLLATYMREDYTVSDNDYLAYIAIKATGHRDFQQIESVENLGIFVAYTYCEFISLLMVLAFICDSILKSRFLTKTG